MIGQEQEALLWGLRAIDLNWTTHIKSVWRDLEYDVPALHHRQRDKIIQELEQLRRTTDPASPLGLVIVGAAGAGKTHLLSAIRRHAVAQGYGFVLADMTDVHNFWATVLQGYISSLQEAGGDDIPQLQKLIAFLVAYTQVDITVEQVTQASASDLKQFTQTMLAALAQRDRPAATRWQNVVRALLLLNSSDFTLSGIGYNWLQGAELEADDRARLGFTVGAPVPLSEIVAGLSWLLSLRSPCILALDQLDSIVTQHHVAAGSGGSGSLLEEQRVSRSIIEGIGGGLTALRDRTCQTLVLVSCLESTWEILRSQAVGTFQDRFQPPLPLGNVVSEAVAGQLVAARLQEVYSNLKFAPPYPTWPFSARFFASAVRQYPRQILQRCHQHREQCWQEQTITELHEFQIRSPAASLAGPGYERLDQALLAAREGSQAVALLEETQEDRLGALLQVACQWLVWENPTPDWVDVAVETDFPGGKSYPLLHVRLRLTFRQEGDREQHLCLRALQKTNAGAYRTRLKAAMTASGIDRCLSFRQLILIRTQEWPTGPTTHQLSQQFEQAGGRWTRPTLDELKTLLALQDLQQQQDPNFEAWLRDRRLVSQLPFLQLAVTWLVTESTASRPAVVATPASPSPAPMATPASPTPTPQGMVRSSTVTIGHRLVGQQQQDPVALQLADLSRHTVVLAGSGSGKTVLVRRLVEEAARQGIPSIVIDGANDLTRLGDRWPTPPAGWQAGDQQAAEHYHQTSQVVLWTPGREAGNPLTLEPLPDLTTVANDQDELDQAVDMARDALQDIAAPGNSELSRQKRGILRAALTYFAQHGGGCLTHFIDLLADLPPEAGGNITEADRKAQSMANSLRAEVLNNPLLRQSGSALDPAILLGLGGVDSPTRISVINFVGLPGLAAQQQFLNQLAMTLFTWIKKHPAPADQPVQGLLVLDEARDFVPATTATVCKANLIRLAAQARKYGLGLVFATQTPKSIDHTIVANCSTQFYGRANSPAAIEVIQEQLRQRGHSGQDIARLETGQFYAVSETWTTPIKLQVPMCLSYHPATPPDEAAVLHKAKTSRQEAWYSGQVC